MNARTVINNQRNLVVVSNLRERGKVCNVELGISNALHIQTLRAFVDRSREHLRFIPIYELDTDVELLEEYLQLVICLWRA
jgi:hypothetical protein